MVATHLESDPNVLPVAQELLDAKVEQQDQLITVEISRPIEAALELLRQNQAEADAEDAKDKPTIWPVSHYLIRDYDDKACLYDAIPINNSEAASLEIAARSDDAIIRELLITQLGLPVSEQSDTGDAAESLWQHGIAIETNQATDSSSAINVLVLDPDQYTVRRVQLPPILMPGDEMDPSCLQANDEHTNHLAHNATDKPPEASAALPPEEAIRPPREHTEAETSKEYAYTLQLVRTETGYEFWMDGEPMPIDHTDQRIQDSITSLLATGSAVTVDEEYGFRTTVTYRALGDLSTLAIGGSIEIDVTSSSIPIEEARLDSSETDDELLILEDDASYESSPTPMHHTDTYHGDYASVEQATNTVFSTLVVDQPLWLSFIADWNPVNPHTGQITEPYLSALAPQMRTELLRQQAPTNTQELNAETTWMETSSLDSEKTPLMVLIDMQASHEQEIEETLVRADDLNQKLTPRISLENLMITPPSLDQLQLSADGQQSPQPPRPTSTISSALSLDYHKPRTAPDMTSATPTTIPELIPTRRSNRQPQDPQPVPMPPLKQTVESAQVARVATEISTTNEVRTTAQRTQQRAAEHRMTASHSTMSDKKMVVTATTLTERAATTSREATRTHNEVVAIREQQHIKTTTRAQSMQEVRGKESTQLAKQQITRQQSGARGATATSTAISFTNVRPRQATKRRTKTTTAIHHAQLPTGTTETARSVMASALDAGVASVEPAQIELNPATDAPILREQIRPLAQLTNEIARATHRFPSLRVHINIKRTAILFRPAADEPNDLVGFAEHMLALPYRLKYSEQSGFVFRLGTAA